MSDNTPSPVTGFKPLVSEPVTATITVPYAPADTACAETINAMIAIRDCLEARIHYDHLTDPISVPVEFVTSGSHAKGVLWELARDQMMNTRVTITTIEARYTFFIFRLGRKMLVKLLATERYE